MAVHPDRYSTSNVVQPKRGVVVHTSEGGEGSSSDENLISFMAQPGDRLIAGSNPPRYFGAAYHAVADGDHDTYTQVLPGSAGPYAAAGANKDFWHICCPGKAGQTREQWLDPMSRGQIKACALFIVDKAKADGFPLTRINGATVKGGGKGYCGHRDISDAYGLSDHWDPGSGFPWDVLAEDIRQLSTEEDDVAPVPVNRRVYDTRAGSGEAGAGLSMAAGETRVIPVSFGGNIVELGITVIGKSSGGYVAVRHPDDTKANTSAGNWERVGGLGGKTVTVAMKNSTIAVFASSPCDLILDNFAVWA